jgi:hypothetical protein
VDTDKITVAARVLMAVSHHQDTAKRDVALLRAYYPDDCNMDADEIACIVIHEQTQKMRETRENKVRAVGGW